MMELQGPVWIHDNNVDMPGQWVKVLDWYDLQIELGYGGLKKGERPLFEKEVTRILKVGVGAYKNGRYHIMTTDPRPAPLKVHPRGCMLLTEIVTHGLGRFYV